MRALLLFLYKHRAFLTFLVLELLCGWLIVQNNRYQNAAFFNSSNRIAAGILNISHEVTSYFSLKKSNQDLAREIAILREKLSAKKIVYLPGDSASLTNDTTDSNPYLFITAEVINNSTRRRNNYLTIDKGTRENIEEGMGVVGGGGVVGKVKYVSKNFSVVTSLLHSDFFISSQVKDKVTLCSIQWNGRDPTQVDLLFVPRHIKLEVGDTVMTSGFNSVFPKDILIGVVLEVEVKEDDPFLQAKVELANDFSQLSYVHVVRYDLRKEKDSLEANTEFE